MSNVKNFISNFKKTELARPYNFDVSFYPSESVISTIISPSLAGKALQLELLKNGRDFKMKCEQAELPARTFSTVEQRIYGYTDKFPISTSYEPITLVFICSDDMNEKYFFDLWMEVISMTNPIGIAVSAAADLAENLLGIDTGFGTRFDLQYKDNYSCMIEITQYDLTGKASYKVMLIAAFPRSVNQMPLRWSDTGSYHRVAVTFEYKYFMIVPL
jgi:hypothetical protein